MICSLSALISQVRRRFKFRGSMNRSSQSLKDWRTNSLRNSNRSKNSFYPGGPAQARPLFVPRPAPRRAERRAVALAETETLNSETIVYLNRLSDLLFILARAVNRRAGIAETMTDFSKKGK